MKPEKSSSLLRKVVDLAKSLGELNHRSFLLKDQLKALHLQAKDDRAFLKTRDHTESWRAKDARQALRDHRRYLVRLGYLGQQELDQIERLAQEVEDQMKEIMGSLLQRIS